MTGEQETGPLSAVAEAAVPAFVELLQRGAGEQVSPEELVKRAGALAEALGLEPAEYFTALAAAMIAAKEQSDGFVASANFTRQLHTLVDQVIQEDRQAST